MGFADDLMVDPLVAAGVRGPYRLAILRTLAAVSMGGAFGLGVLRAHPHHQFIGHEWFQGYALEVANSLDNLFAYYMVFYFLRVPLQCQDRVLGFGVLLAMVARGAMIGVGPRLLQVMQYGLPVFALALLGCGARLIRGLAPASSGGGGDGEEADNEDPDMRENTVVWCFGMVLPMSPQGYDGSRFISSRDSRFTPLAVALLCLEVTDAFFAIDSIPEVYAVSQDPYLIYTSNLFAIFALRALYIVVAHACADIPALRKAVGVVCVLEAGRVMGGVLGIAVSTSTMIAVISIVVGAGIVAGVGASSSPSSSSGGARAGGGGAGVGGGAGGKAGGRGDGEMGQAGEGDAELAILAVEDKPSQD